MSGLDVHGTETEICPSCREKTNFVEEWRSGDLVCSSCGFCFPERLVDPGEEKRKFSDSSDDPHRSARVDPYLEMLPGTIIAREVVTVGGNITHTNHLGKRQAAMVSRHDRSLVQVFDKINHVCSKLVLPERVRSRAKEIFSKYKNAKAEQGKAIPKAEGLVAAVICLACKEEKLPRTPKELAFDTGVREKTIRKHFRELQELQRKAGGWNKSQAVSTTNPSDLVPRVCTKLRLPFDPVVSAAVAVATKAKDFLEGKHPNSIAAASVFLVCGLLEEFRRSQDDIATAAHISPSTLRSVHRELLQYQHEVLPPQLLPQASSTSATLQQATPSPAQSGIPSPAGTSPSVSSPSSISSEEDGIAV